MKSIHILIVLAVLATTVHAQNKKYIQTMQASIPLIFQTQSMEAFDPLANKFDRIGQAESYQWEPYYYAALTHTFKSFRIQDLATKDVALDNALASIKKGKSIANDNAELIALQGFVNMLKISVDPGTRGQTLSPKIMADYSKALQIDPTNPRANLFKAQMLLGTAQFFGSGVEQACGMIDQSIVLFDSQASESTIAPTWGKFSALQSQEQCKAALSKATSKE